MSRRGRNDMANILLQCFRNQTDDQLVVAYSLTPAFG